MPRLYRLAGVVATSRRLRGAHRRPTRIEDRESPSYWVQSESGNGEYRVYQSERGYRVDCCTCPDHTERGGVCKHAIRLLQACERAETNRHEPTPFPLDTYSHEDRFKLTKKGYATLAAIEPVPVA